MAWDDFMGAVEDFQQGETFQDITSYIQNNPSTLTLVKNAIVPPAGNQSAAQIAAGQAGGTAPLAKPASAGTAAGAALGIGGGKIAGMSVGLLLVLGVGAFLIFGKKGR